MQDDSSDNRNQAKNDITTSSNTDNPSTEHYTNMVGDAYDGDIASGTKKPKPRKEKSNNEIGNEYYECILNKLDELQKDVNYIKKHINETSKNNNDELLKILQSKLPDITSEPKIKIKDETQNNSSKEDYDIVKEFVDIYNSETIKKSISINKELEQQIKVLIAKHYDIRDNDSKIINTALMIALLKMCK